MSTPAIDGKMSCDPIEKTPLPMTAVADSDDETPQD
jgi:hypothetical protein